MGINRIFTEMIHCLLLLLAALPLHLWPPQEARMTVLETERRDGYTCQRIEYHAVGPQRVQAFLMREQGEEAAELLLE